MPAALTLLSVAVLANTNPKTQLLVASVSIAYKKSSSEGNFKELRYSLASTELM